MRNTKNLGPLRVRRVGTMGVFAMVWLVAAGCGRKADLPPVPPQDTAPAAPEVAPTPPEPPKPGPSWLVWRQDAGGMGVTALITAKNADGSGEEADILSVNKVLLAVGGGDVWSFGPATERWPLKPCDEEGVGIARGFRYQRLNLAVENGLPGDIGMHAWSVGDRRPDRGASAMHNEYLAVKAQVGSLLFLEHVTVSDTCPVPAGGSTEVDHWVFDMASGRLVSPVDVLTTEEKAALGATAIEVAVVEITNRRKTLSADTVREALALAGLAFRWTEDGRVEGTLKVSGTSPHFAPEDDPSGMLKPVESVTVPLMPMPAALKGGPVPPAVMAWWKKGWAEDAARAVPLDEAGLYGGVGWAAVPPELVAKVRKELESRRDAPTPDGPTDWD